ncbi:LysR substrate-binding domain-containing protein [Variovorax sp.]|jgi:DNA-binding transcriptional LysR family regulator|uniref:LysR substrate-binding domain-containing protein n=1 Tax=Variovorax sp. TaxID=1871043 RepID=UPI001226B643|nr:LysR substrate-binding domain-containing protein [Variovorax sp.]TAJ64777.1 MAG: transcriptional regulator LrhA [Variovorax sp.]
MSFRNLDIGLLRTFVAVAEKENFAIAAEKVFRTQAAVSQQMQKLETVLGCALFERVGRNKRLTTEGSRFLEYARRIVGLNDEAYRAMAQRAFDEPVKVGACADSVDSLIPGYLEMCAEAFPGLRVDIQVGRSRWLTSSLRRGEVDLVVMLDPVPNPEFDQVVLRTSPVTWIAGARYHHQAGAPVPLILIEGSCPFRNMAIKALSEAGIPWRTAFQTSTLAGIRAALRAGMGITPRTVEMLAPDLKVLDPHAGLPALPTIGYRLYARPGKLSESALDVSRLVSPR